MIEFVGTHHTFGRCITGFHSLDRAMQGGQDELGFPTRSLVEIYGPTGVGKTTLSLALLGLMSKSLDNAEIACADLEQQDENMVINVLSNAGYVAKFNWVNPPTVRGVVDDRDEAILQELLSHINQEPPCLGLLDSVASISPVAEVEGDIGDANMGRRAFPMAQFVRRAIRVLRTQELPSCVIMTNHWMEKMGAIGPVKQYIAPGGSVKENLGHVRIQVKVPFVDYVSSGESKVAARWEGSWVLEGRVEKNRAGEKDTKFQVFIYGGWGVHHGMTAIMDCLASGLATVERGKVVMDGTDYGLLKNIIERERDNRDFFNPFMNTLRENDVPVIEEDEVEEEEPVVKKGKRK